MVSSEVPLATRSFGRAYDFSVIGLGVWILVADADWLSWTCFLLANALGLLVFDNHLLRRPLPLTRPWLAVVIFFSVCAIMMWPLMWHLWDQRSIRGASALVVFIATRALMTRVPRMSRLVHPRANDRTGR